MTDILKEIEVRLQRDLGSPEAEWDVSRSLLEQFESEASVILEWIFLHHKGYIDTRARAGLQVFKNNPVKGRDILERLIGSGDADDRDTALAVLEALGDIDLAERATPLLSDPMPYLQLEAATFLREHFPVEVKARLEDLVRHEADWVARSARDLLHDMEKDGPES